MKIVPSEVEVKIGQVVHKAKVEYREAETADDILELLNAGPESVKQVLKTWNYGENLNARSIVRQRIQKHEAAPEKSREKMIKTIIDMHALSGITLTKEQAIEKLNLISPPSAPQASV
jgi:hypothetical protein